MVPRKIKAKSRCSSNSPQRLYNDEVLSGHGNLLQKGKCLSLGDIMQSPARYQETSCVTRQDLFSIIKQLVSYYDSKIAKLEQAASESTNRCAGLINTFDGRAPETKKVKPQASTKSLKQQASA